MLLDSRSLEFNEEDHPRDDHGRWTTGGSGVTADIPEYDGASFSDQVSETMDSPIKDLHPTQPKADLDRATVEKLKDMLRQGIPLPPIVAEYTGGTRGNKEAVDVIDGHHRLKAAQELGYKRVPIKMVTRELSMHGALEFNEEDHPRAPKGDSRGGEWVAGSNSGEWQNPNHRTAADISGHVPPGSKVQTRTLYHTTRTTNVESILKNGFDLSKIKPNWLNDYAVSTAASLKDAKAWFQKRDPKTGKDLPLDTSKYAVVEIKVRGRFGDSEGDVRPTSATSSYDYTRRVVKSGWDAADFSGNGMVYIYNSKSILSIRPINMNVALEFNEEDHPRVPKGDSRGGVWTTSGATSAERVGVYEESTSYMEWASKLESGKIKGKGVLRTYGSEGSMHLRFEASRKESEGAWSGSPNSLKMQAVEELVKNAPKHEGLVFRGMVVNSAQAKTYQTGSEVRMGIVSSWSRDLNVAASFGQAAFDRGDEGYETLVLFRLKSRKSTVSIERFAPIADVVQREVVNVPGARYRITGSRQANVKFSYGRMGFKGQVSHFLIVDLEER